MFMKNNAFNRLERRNYWIIFSFISLFSFVIFIGSLFAGGENSFHFNALFIQCNDLFGDLTNNIGYASHLNPYYEEYVWGAWERIYPPMVYLICYGISRVVNINIYIDNGSFVDMLGDNKLLFVIAALFIPIVIASMEVYKYAKNGSSIERDLTAISLILSYPFIYAFERGNFIIICALLNTFFLLFHNHKNKFIREIALIMLALSSSIKFPPAFLGIILIFEKKWREALRTVLYGIMGFIIPMLFLHGGLANIEKLFQNIILNISIYSPFSGATFTSVVYAISGGTLTEQAVPYIKIISYFFTAVMLISIPFLRRNWLKIGILCLVLTIVPSHSAYYCLTYLFPLIIAFLNEKEYTKTEIVPFIAICLLIVVDPLIILCRIGVFVLVVYCFACSVCSIITTLFQRTRIPLPKIEK